MNNKLYILTGAPGVGKTTLLNALRQLPLKCVPEPARQVLAIERANLGEALPEKNPFIFCQKLLQHAIADFKIYRQQSDLTIFDRGIPDVIAYADYFSLKTTEFEISAQNYLYNKNVFLLPPWSEIYCTDEERKMNFSETNEFNRLICKAYRDQNYNLIEVPRASVNERVEFIKKQLER